MCTSRLFPVAVGRERDTFGCAGCLNQSANPLSFCHHKSYALAELQIKRSWLCASIISWHPLPKAITTQLKTFNAA